MASLLASVLAACLARVVITLVRELVRPRRLFSNCPWGPLRTCVAELGLADTTLALLAECFEVVGGVPSGWYSRTGWAA